jgi:hypothetical protein
MNLYDALLAMDDVGTAALCFVVVAAFAIAAIVFFAEDE